MIKYEVHWVRYPTQEDKTHGVYNTLEEAIQSVYDWWHLNDYSPIYVRQYTVNGVTALDYGFHSMFYKIKEIQVEDTSLTDKPVIHYTLDKDGKAPSRGRDLDVAHDMYTSEDAFILPDRLGATIVKSGVHTEFDPTKYGLLINLRSGMSKYPLALANSTGIIEGTYRGDVGFPLRNTNRLGFCPQSNYVITLDKDGKLTHLTADELYDNHNSVWFNHYLPELDKMIADFSLLFGDEMASNFGKAIKSTDLDGNRAVPAGTFWLPKGTRVAQAYLIDRKDTTWTAVDSLSESERGEAGYGSSGVN